MQITYKQGLWGMGVVFTLAVGWRVSNQVIRWRDGETVVGKQIVLSQPVRKMDYSCLVQYQGESVFVTQRTCETSGLLSTRPGDEVTIYGKASVSVRKHEFSIWSYWWWVRWLGEVHDWCTRMYTTHLPEPAGSLVAGVVIGEQAQIPTSLNADFRRTGTAHIVSASGFNVTVVMGLALGIAVRWLGRKRGLVMAAVLVWMYMLLAGATPPVLRAGMMGIVMMVGVGCGRMYWSGWSIILVSGIMLLAQPWLISSLSWQLSTAATAGVIWGTGLLVIPKHNPTSFLYLIWNELQTSFDLTLAATIMTAPLLLNAFGESSWLGLVVNPLVLWLVPPLMYLGGLLLILGFIWSGFGDIMAWITAPLAWFILTIIKLGARLPGGVIQVSMNWWIAGGWWCLWLGWWGIRRKAPKGSLRDMESIEV